MLNHIRKLERTAERLAVSSETICGADREARIGNDVRVAWRVEYTSEGAEKLVS